MEDAMNMNMRPRGRHGGRGGHGGPRRGEGFGGPRGPRARRGHVRLAILALLAEEPLNGYQIIQALEERTQGAWRPSPGAVYPALAQLEDEGLVTATDHEGQRAFRLTPTGEAAATAVDPKPWESARPFGPRVAQGASVLHRELDALALAARAVELDADAGRIERAGQLLADARRSLHALLAEPHPTTPAPGSPAPESGE